MLYLLAPPYQLHWTPQPESWIDLAKEHGTDLGQIDWAPAEEPHSPSIVVRLALRYGTECSRGIVLPAWTLSQAEKPV
ncbi:hypothetical protein I8D64_03190 [Brachybacterium sp. MASK1Z-5]|uniref:Uncharacterized protein n=1 Tax=Brachybacterium halotolerans TaxID=2795215 RepID=A0ABS1B6Y8_9MICO|nr:hypothetical protein [Brachybacterium halotolerans]MBK0330403.1 hypothetical protein [Brachybacterium halotolerans]